MRMEHNVNRRTWFKAGAAGITGALGATVAGTAWAQPQSPAGSPSVRDFGAVGDGLADDTGAIQKAVDAAEGGCYFPHGTYRLTGTIRVDLDRIGPVSIQGNGTATLIMAGPGPALRLVGTHEGTADPGTVKDNVWRNQRAPLLDGLEIVGDHPDAIGIELMGAMQAIISRVVVRRALHGIHLVTRNRNVIIAECHLYENRGIGIYLDNVNLHQINIANSHISYNGGGGIVMRGGQVRNLQVGVCDIESNMSPDLPPTANILFDTTGGSLAEAAIVGCTIQHNHNAPGSANIRVIGAGGIATRGQAPGNITIADNVLSDIFTNIHLQDARGITIVGNTMWKGYTHNIFIERSTHITLSANMLDRNPAYQPGEPPNDVLIEDSADCIINGVDINNTRGSAAALIIRRSQRMNITGCSILDCDNGGILLDGVEHTRVSDCIIRDDRAGAPAFVPVTITQGRGNMIVHNLLDGKVDVATDSAVVAGNYNSRA